MHAQLAGQSLCICKCCSSRGLCEVGYAALACIFWEACCAYTSCLGHKQVAKDLSTASLCHPRPQHKAHPLERHSSRRDGLPRL